MSNVSDKVRRAYDQSRHLLRRGEMQYPVYINELCDFARDTLARAMKAEFWLQHQTSWVGRYEDQPACTGCKLDDWRHAWTLEEWQQAADAELRGEKGQP